LPELSENEGLQAVQTPVTKAQAEQF